VLRAARETETTQENIQDGGGPGFQLLTEQEIAAVIFLYIFSSTTYIIKFSSCLFATFFLFGLRFL
jgi:hypothetical protein